MSANGSAVADDVDLFAGGAGGWDLAARELGFDPLGVEVDAAACATREAAGLRTWRQDVAAVDLSGFPKVRGVIGSPPCPTFSSAGGGAGRRVVRVITGCARALAERRDIRASAIARAFAVLEPAEQEREFARSQRAGRPPDTERARGRAQRDAELSLLVVEPLRWALALAPEWVALEQVPDVLPLWRVFGEILRARGYSVWSGILEAERFGVPQTRERAILMASRVRKAAPPVPTHQRYVKGEPAREEHTLEGVILPWVSMAEALGWGMTERPSATLTAKVGQTGGRRPLEGGSGSRALLNGERDRGAWTDAPAPTVTSGGTNGGGGVEVFAGRDGRARIAAMRPEARRRLRVNAQPNATVRDEGEPAPTIKGGHDTADRVWESVVDTGNTRGGTRVEGRERLSEEPSATITQRADQLEKRSRADGCGDPLGLKGEDWPERRPATTIVGEGRVFQPGGHHGHGQQSQNTIRVSVEEAAVLQGFPPDHPWRGSRTKQFKQVGNAIPPQLARAVLAALG